MPVWILRFWDKLRGSFWFVPLLMIFAAAVLALLICWIDGQVHFEEQGPWSWLLINAATARSTLSLLSGSMITLSGVVFSMTMVTLSLTSSQFGSRLLRTAMTDLTMQVALGAFLATTMYCLMVLRFIRVDGPSPFVPHLAVFAGGVLTFGSLVVMILFVHHVGVSIQAQNVVAEVAEDLNDAILRLFPERLGQPRNSDDESTENEQPELGSRREDSSFTLQASTEGYLQTVDVDHLMAFACEHDLTIELLYRPGDFIIKGSPLVRIKNLSKLAREQQEEMTKTLNAAFLTGRSRTPRQDVCCAVNELVEMAVRALSPGINDPFTALACIDHMTAAMSRLLQRDTPSAFRYDENQNLRVIARPTPIPAVIEAAYAQIGSYGAGDWMVLTRLMEGLEHLSTVATCDSDRKAVVEQAKRLFQRAQDQQNQPHHVERLKSEYERICKACRN